MQKDLLKLALTGLAAGVCLSAQGGGEIAMMKCSKTPPANQEQKGSGQQQKEDLKEGDEMDEEMDEDSSSCNSQQGSCANQGDQSSQSERPRHRNYMQTKRLSAAKTAMGGERFPDMDK